MFAVRSISYASLLFLSGCALKKVHQENIVINGEGAALVTPSKLFKKLDSTKKVESFSLVPLVSTHQQSKSSIEARLTDVPVLVGAQLVDATVDQKNNKHFIYKITSQLENASSTYARELEQAGWQLSTQYCDEKFVTLIAKKPQKNAVLLFESYGGSWLLQAYVILHITVTHQ